MMIKIYTDASTKENPGPSGVGILIIENGHQTQLSVPLTKDYTNHQAEFIAQIIALDYIKKHFNNLGTIFLYSDSKIAVQSIEKRYAKEFQSYVDQLIPYFDENPLLFIKWIPEKQNKGADNLARQALQKRLAGQSDSLLSLGY